MLAVLFLGARMRAEQITQGRTDEFVVPSARTQWCMQIATWSVLLQTVVVLAVPVFSGEMNVPTDEEGNVDLEQLGYWRANR